MKPTLKCVDVNICLSHFLLRNVLEQDLCHQHFGFIQNALSGKSKEERDSKTTNWTLKAHSFSEFSTKSCKTPLHYSATYSCLLIFAVSEFACVPTGCQNPCLPYYQK